MHTREIPKETWGTYLSSLSSTERQCPIRIERDDEELGQEVVTEGMPLYGLSMDEKGSDAGFIEVTLGKDDPVMSHRIEGASHLWVEERDGKIESMDIEDDEHRKTIISFLH